MDYSKSITEWGPADFKKAGMLKLDYIAKHGHPFHKVCKLQLVDLAEEDGKLFLVCPNCGDARYLNEEEDLRVQRARTRSPKAYRNPRF